MLATSPAEAQRLLSIVDAVGPFRLLSTAPDSYTFGVDDAYHTQATLVVNLVAPGHDLTRVRSAHYATSIWNASPDTHVLDVLARGARAIVDADGGSVTDAAVHIQGADLHQMVTATAIVVAVAALLANLNRRRFTVDVRKAHVIQACVHSSIFLYWSLYWPGVRAQLPMIAFMLVMAYAADAAFSYTKAGSWRIGLSPLPVVFSTNLFVWLDWHGAGLAMVGALACKTFVQRDGRHIFNPSVAGLTLCAIATVVAPGLVHFGGLFHTLNIAPDMSEWVFLVSLIPLTMFRLLPVSIGGILGLLYITHTPGALRPTLLLMLTLLCTDPATTPKSSLGRFLFGVLVGVSYPLYSHALRSLGQPDDFAKILSVPLANFLTPSFDRVAQWSRARAQGMLRGAETLRRAVPSWAPLPNIAFVASWLVLYAVPLRAEKPRDFEPALHFTWGTPHVASGTDAVPQCEDNPVFCTPFSFAREAALWTFH
jgi:hypothetical protein